MVNLPESLPAVRYFLEVLDTQEWIVVFRAIFAGIMLISASVFIRYRKRLPKEEAGKRRIGSDG
ncbi:hypothetical protein FACS189447_04410 [Spirochaetia bacterium]|nr:hypothetical protein FACS189447_04410 [Spirochaetia bacterium]